MLKVKSGKILLDGIPAGRALAALESPRNVLIGQSSIEDEETAIDPADVRTFGRVQGGIWTAGEAKQLSRLGTHPCYFLRDIAGIPAGVANLGATCFLNVWQQVLFRDEAFRASVFAIGDAIDALLSQNGNDYVKAAGMLLSLPIDDIPPKHRRLFEGLKQQPAAFVLGGRLAAVRALAAAWAHMAFGRRAFFKPEAMVHILQIPPNVQQDAGEYFGTFVNFIQDVAQVALQGRESASVLCLREFCRVSTMTTRRCLRCKKVSSKEEEHRVLGLSMTSDSRDFQALMRSSFKSELMYGSNAYECSRCIHNRKIELMTGGGAANSSSSSSSARAAPRSGSLDASGPSGGPGLSEAEAEAIAKKLRVPMLTRHDMHRLPPKLAVQVNRFHYDFTTLTTKKSHKAICPPTLLNLSRLVEEGQASVDNPGIGKSHPDHAAFLEAVALKEADDAQHKKDALRGLGGSAAGLAGPVRSSSASSSSSSSAASSAPRAGSSDAKSLYGGDEMIRSLIGGHGPEEGVGPDGKPLPVLYELEAVIYHKGATAKSGHYTCDVWDAERCRWLRCDDNEVYPFGADGKRVKEPTSSASPVVDLTSGPPSPGPKQRARRQDRASKGRGGTGGGSRLPTKNTQQSQLGETNRDASTGSQQQAKRTAGSSSASAVTPEVSAESRTPIVTVDACLDVSDSESQSAPADGFAPRDLADAPSSAARMGSERADYQSATTQSLPPVQYVVGTQQLPHRAQQQHMQSMSSTRLGSGAVSSGTVDPDHQYRQLVSGPGLQLAPPPPPLVPPSRGVPVHAQGQYGLPTQPVFPFQVFGQQPEGSQGMVWQPVAAVYGHRVRHAAAATQQHSIGAGFAAPVGGTGGAGAPPQDGSGMGIMPRDQQRTGRHRAGPGGKGGGRSTRPRRGSRKLPSNGSAAVVDATQSQEVAESDQEVQEIDSDLLGDGKSSAKPSRARSRRKGGSKQPAAKAKSPPAAKAVQQEAEPVATRKRTRRGSTASDAGMGLQESSSGTAEQASSTAPDDAPAASTEVSSSLCESAQNTASSSAEDKADGKASAKKEQRAPAGGRQQRKQPASVPPSKRRRTSTRSRAKSAARSSKPMDSEEANHSGKDQGGDGGASAAGVGNAGQSPEEKSRELALKLHLRESPRMTRRKAQLHATDRMVAIDLGARDKLDSDSDDGGEPKHKDNGQEEDGDDDFQPEDIDDGDQFGGGKEDSNGSTRTTGTSYSKSVKPLGTDTSIGAAQADQEQAAESATRSSSSALTAAAADPTPAPVTFQPQRTSSHPDAQMILPGSKGTRRSSRKGFTVPRSTGQTIKGATPAPDSKLPSSRAAVPIVTAEAKAPKAAATRRTRGRAAASGSKKAKAVQATKMAVVREPRAKRAAASKAASKLTFIVEELKSPDRSAALGQIGGNGSMAAENGEATAQPVLQQAPSVAMVSALSAAEGSSSSSGTVAPIDPPLTGIPVSNSVKWDKVLAAAQKNLQDFRVKFSFYAGGRVISRGEISGDGVAAATATAASAYASLLRPDGRAQPRMGCLESKPLPKGAPIEQAQLALVEAEGKTEEAPAVVSVAAPEPTTSQVRDAIAPPATASDFSPAGLPVAAAALRTMPSAAESSQPVESPAQAHMSQSTDFSVPIEIEDNHIEAVLPPVVPVGADAGLPTPPTGCVGYFTGDASTGGRVRAKLHGPRTDSDSAGFNDRLGTTPDRGIPHPLIAGGNSQEYQQRRLHPIFSSGECSKAAFMLVYSRVSASRTREWVEAEAVRAAQVESGKPNGKSGIARSGASGQAAMETGTEMEGGEREGQQEGADDKAVELSISDDEPEEVVVNGIPVPMGTKISQKKQALWRKRVPPGAEDSDEDFEPEAESSPERPKRKRSKSRKASEKSKRSKKTEEKEKPPSKSSKKGSTKGGKGGSKTSKTRQAAMQYPATGGYDMEIGLPPPPTDPHLRLRQHTYAVACTRQVWKTHWAQVFPGREYPTLPPAEDGLLPSRDRLEAVARANERAERRCIEFVRAYCGVLRAVNARRMLAAALFSEDALNSGCVSISPKCVSHARASAVEASFGPEDAVILGSEMQKLYQDIVLEGSDAAGRSGGAPSYGTSGCLVIRSTDGISRLLLQLKAGNIPADAPVLVDSRWLLAWIQGEEGLQAAGSRAKDRLTQKNEAIYGASSNRKSPKRGQVQQRVDHGFDLPASDPQSIDSLVSRWKDEIKSELVAHGSGAPSEVEAGSPVRHLDLTGSDPISKHNAASGDVLELSDDEDDQKMRSESRRVAGPPSGGGSAAMEDDGDDGDDGDGDGSASGDDSDLEVMGSSHLSNGAVSAEDFANSTDKGLLQATSGATEVGAGSSGGQEAKVRSLLLQWSDFDWSDGLPNQSLHEKMEDAVRDASSTGSGSQTVDISSGLAMSRLSRAPVKSSLVLGSGRGSEMTGETQFDPRMLPSTCTVSAGALAAILDPESAAQAVRAAIQAVIWADEAGSLPDSIPEGLLDVETSSQAAPTKRSTGGRGGKAGAEGNASKRGKGGRSGKGGKAKSTTLDEHFKPQEQGEQEPAAQVPLNRRLAGPSALIDLVREGAALAGIDKLACDPYGSIWAETLGGDCSDAIERVKARMAGHSWIGARRHSERGTYVVLSSDDESDGGITEVSASRNRGQRSRSAGAKSTGRAEDKADVETQTAHAGGKRGRSAADANGGRPVKRARRGQSSSDALGGSDQEASNEIQLGPLLLTAAVSSTGRSILQRATAGSSFGDQELQVRDFDHQSVDVDTALVLLPPVPPTASGRSRKRASKSKAADAQALQSQIAAGTLGIRLPQSSSGLAAVLLRELAARMAAETMEWGAQAIRGLNDTSYSIAQSIKIVCGEPLQRKKKGKARASSRRVAAQTKSTSAEDQTQEKSNAPPGRAKGALETLAVGRSSSSAPSRSNTVDSQGIDADDDAAAAVAAVAARPTHMAVVSKDLISSIKRRMQFETDVLAALNASLRKLHRTADEDAALRTVMAMHPAAAEFKYLAGHLAGLPASKDPVLQNSGSVSGVVDLASSQSLGEPEIKEALEATETAQPPMSGAGGDNPSSGSSSSDKETAAPDTSPLASDGAVSAAKVVASLVEPQPCETRADWLLAVHAALIPRRPPLDQMACNWKANDDLATPAHGLLPGRGGRTAIYMQGFQVILRACLRLALQETTKATLEAAMLSLQRGDVRDPFAGTEGGWVHRWSRLTDGLVGALPMPREAADGAGGSTQPTLIPEHEAKPQLADASEACFAAADQAAASELLDRDPAIVADEWTILQIASALAAIGRPAHYFHNRQRDCIVAQHAAQEERSQAMEAEEIRERLYRGSHLKNLLKRGSEGRPKPTNGTPSQVPLSANKSFRLMPRDWIQVWRDYHSDRSVAAVQPTVSESPMRRYLSKRCLDAVDAVLQRAAAMKEKSNERLKKEEVDALLLELGAPVLDLPLATLSYLQFIAPVIAPSDREATPELPLGIRAAGHSLPVDGPKQGGDPKLLDESAESQVSMSDEAGGACGGGQLDTVIHGSTMAEDKYLRVGSWPWYTGSTTVGDATVVVPSETNAKSLDPGFMQVEILNSEEYEQLVRRFPFPSVLGDLLESEAEAAHKQCQVLEARLAEADAAGDSKARSTIKKMMAVRPDAPKVDTATDDTRRAIRVAYLRRAWAACAPEVRVRSGDALDPGRDVGRVFGRSGGLRDAIFSRGPSSLDMQLEGAALGDAAGLSEEALAALMDDAWCGAGKPRSAEVQAALQSISVTGDMGAAARGGGNEGGSGTAATSPVSVRSVGPSESDRVDACKRSGVAWAIAPPIDVRALESRLKRAEQRRWDVSLAGLQTPPLFVRVVHAASELPMEYPRLPEVPEEAFIKGLEPSLPIGVDLLGMLAQSGDASEAGGGRSRRQTSRRSTAATLHLVPMTVEKAGDIPGALYNTAVAGVGSHQSEAAEARCMQYLGGSVMRSQQQELEKDLPLSACTLPIFGVVYCVIGDSGGAVKSSSASSSSNIGFSGSLMT